MYDFGLLLRQLREKSGLTQEQLAKKINRTKTVISKYENNQQSPTLDTLIEMAVIFNVSLDYLAGIDNKNAISLQGLTPRQENILQILSNEFRKIKADSQEGLTIYQLDIVNQLLIEFTSKYNFKKILD